MDITEDTPLEQLLIDPAIHPQFDPAKTEERAPARINDNRFGPNSRSPNITWICEGCGDKKCVRLSRHTRPIGAYMVRQHRRRRNRASDTPPLPARRFRKSKWDNLRWAARWRCRRCFERIYGVGAGRVDSILAVHRKALLPNIPGSHAGEASSSVDSEGAAGTESEVEQEEQE